MTWPLTAHFRHAVAHQLEDLISDSIGTRRKSRIDLALNLGTLVLFVLAVVVAFPMLKRQLFPEAAVEYATIPTLAGRNIDSLVVAGDSGSRAIQLDGKPTLVYLFATTCHFCESQRSHMAKLLATIPSSIRVLTVSNEPAAMTATYWKQVRGFLPQPLSLNVVSMAALEAATVPRLYFIGSDGRIRMALTGTVLGWNSDSLRRVLGNIGREIPAGQ